MFKTKCHYELVHYNINSTPIIKWALVDQQQFLTLVKSLFETLASRF